MRQKETNYNPLKEFFTILGNEGVIVSKHNLIKIGELFNKGGLICETSQEVLDVIAIFSEMYGFTEIIYDTSINIHKIRNKDGNQNPQQV